MLKLFNVVESLTWFESVLHAVGSKFGELHIEFIASEVVVMHLRSQTIKLGYGRLINILYYDIHLHCLSFMQCCSNSTLVVYKL